MTKKERPVWLLARYKNPQFAENKGELTRDTLEMLGFTIIGEHDILFYEVHPPEGWTKDGGGHHRTNIRNPRGVIRISQYYKFIGPEKKAFLDFP